MERLNRILSLGTLALVMSPALTGAEPLTYEHDGKALLSIDFPADWIIDTDYIEEAKAAGTYQGGEPEIRIVEASEPEDATLAGMAAKTFHGSAKRQGEAVEFAMALLEPRDGVIVSVLYVGQPDTWAKHEDELTAIVESLRPVGG